MDIRREMIVEDGNIIDVSTANVDDLKAVADVAKAMKVERAYGTSEMRPLMEVPRFVIEMYCNTNGVTFAEFMRNPVHANRMLKDPDLKHFRIWEGSENRIFTGDIKAQADVDCNV